MGVLVNQEFEDGCRIGVWEIVESYETLFEMVYLSDEDIQRLNGFKNLSRKIESLSVRALLQKMTASNARIVYKQQSRKPFLADNSYSISISHSHAHTAILLGRSKHVGIDLEFMSHNIERIAHKFINQNEEITDDPLKKKEHLYIHWCAKEALYKICDKIDINFQQNLTIKPFRIASKGTIIGIVHNNLRNEEYTMHYLLENNYVMVYCAE